MRPLFPLLIFTIPFAEGASVDSCGVTDAPEGFLLVEKSQALIFFLVRGGCAGITTPTEQYRQQIGGQLRLPDCPRDYAIFVQEPARGQFYQCSMDVTI